MALVARLSRLPKGTAWFISAAQVSNNLGQPLLVDFLVAGVGADGRSKAPVPLRDFIEAHKLAATLHTEAISEADIAILQALLPKAAAAINMHMEEAQAALESSMKTQLDEYALKMDAWRDTALQQLALDFGEGAATAFQERIRDSRQREIDTILSASGQYHADLASLQGDAYIKMLAVFYNF